MGVMPRDDDDDDTPRNDRPEIVTARITAIDAAKNTIHVRPEEDEGIPEHDIAITASIKVSFGGKPVTVSELRPGMRCDLVYKGNSKTLLEVRARWPQQSVRIRGIDAAAGTITVQTGDDDEDDNGFEITLTAKDAAVLVDGIPAALGDVSTGRKIRVDLGIDKKSVIRIDAEGDPADLPVLIQKYNPTSQTLIVVLNVEQGRVHRKVTLALPVATDARVRHAGRDVKLIDLKERMPARLKLSADRTAVVGILVADPLPVNRDDDDD
jgi:hypothetical protein